MSLHDELVEQARHLCDREARRPKQASLRRAISTAYYALFHCLVAGATSSLVPRRHRHLRPLLGRVFEHAGMARGCERLLKHVVKPAPMAPIMGAAVCPNEPERRSEPCRAAASPSDARRRASSHPTRATSLARPGRAVSTRRAVPVGAMPSQPCATCQSSPFPSDIPRPATSQHPCMTILADPAPADPARRAEPARLRRSLSDMPFLAGPQRPCATDQAQVGPRPPTATSLSAPRLPRATYPTNPCLTCPGRRAEPVRATPCPRDEPLHAPSV